MPAKMLVRALKVLDLFLNGTVGTGIDTAALDQPGDEGCAYGRAAPNWQRLTRNLRPGSTPQWREWADALIVVAGPTNSNH
jgi:hypothetical protein